MNILVIAPTPYFSDRGCHIRILEEISALKKAGHTPVLYTYHLGRDVGDILTYRTHRLAWYKKTSAGPAWAKLYIDLLLLWKILRTARQHSFDIIHAHLHEGAWIGWWVKLWLRKPLILDAQGSLVGEMNSYGFFKIPGIKSVFWIIERWTVNRADYIFTSSQAAYDFIRSHFPKSTSKLSLLGDAVSVKLPDVSIEKTTQVCTSLRLPSDADIIIYTGGLSRIKGIDLLLEAIPHVIAQHPQAYFVIVGYPEIERCKKIVDQLGVTARVRFTGQIDYFTLPVYLQLATVAVDPKPAGAGEASGKLLNYMAAGVPVVAFDSVNARSMLADTGVLASSETPENLAQAIHTLLDKPELRKSLGEKAKQRIHDHFSWDARIHQAINIYDRLANR